jgi:hypothetical protein
MTFLQSFSEKLKIPMSLIFSEDYSKLQGLDPAAQRLLEALQTLLFDAQAIQIKKARKNIRQIASGQG